LSACIIRYGNGNSWATTSGRATHPDGSSVGLRSPLVGFGTGGPIDSGVVGGGGTRNGTTSVPRSVFPTRPVSKSGSLQTGCSARSGGRSNGNHHAPPGLGNHLCHPAAARGSALLFRPRSRPRSPRSLLFRPGSRPRFLGATAEARLNLAYLHSVVRPPARRKRGVLFTIRVPPFPRRRTPPSVTSRCRSTPIRSASTIASSPP
jgi:hypothetical protein